MKTPVAGGWRRRKFAESGKLLHDVIHQEERTKRWATEMYEAERKRNRRKRKSS
jgi:hypothetical protein